MLSRVTLHCHMTTIALNICSQSLQNIDCYKIKYFLPRFISPLTRCSGAARFSSKENGLQISIFVYLHFSIFIFHFCLFFQISHNMVVNKKLIFLYVFVYLHFSISVNLHFFHIFIFAFFPYVYMYICYFPRLYICSFP